MLEIRDYTKNEISELLGTRDKQGIDRKLQGYGVEFTSDERGENRIYTIKNILFPFKVFSITELGFNANTDFIKLRNFYNHFFNDEVFMTMPDEVKETMTKQEGYHLSRQTIATYTRRLETNNMIHRNTTEFMYYFAYKREQRFVERAEYTQAWREYWKDIERNMYSYCGSQSKEPETREKVLQTGFFFCFIPIISVRRRSFLLSADSQKNRLLK